MAEVSPDALADFAPPECSRLEEVEGELERVKRQLKEAEVRCEEMKASNEELSLVNTEIGLRVDELAAMHSHLMATDVIATLFVDRNLAVRHHSSRATELFNLSPGDSGRLLSQLQSRLVYPELPEDAEDVLRTLTPVQREVHDEERCFIARLQPYRIADNHLAGVMLTLVDVTDQREAAELVELDLKATAILSEVSRQTIRAGDHLELLDAILGAAMVVVGADAGTIQVLDSRTEILRITSSRNVPKHVLEHFAEVSASSRSPCGRALHSGQRATTLFDASLPDPTGDNRWHREEAGWLSAQSTPLIGRGGQVLGMMSTHWKVAHFPSDRQMRFFDLLARQASDVVERQQAEERIGELQQMVDATGGA